MKITLKDAADLIGGKIAGNENLEISNIAKIDEAIPGDLTFLYLPAYDKYLETTKASAIIVNSEFDKTRREDISYIVVEKPNIAFQKIIIEFFTPKLPLEGIDKTAIIHPSTKIGNNVAIGKNVVIDADCSIGDNSIIYHNSVIMHKCDIGENALIYPNVTIREESIIGSNVIIHSGTVIGSDGFGFSPNEEGVYFKVPQIGNVIIGDNVELGSNVSIDRAALGSTVIKNGTKIDNLVQIAHNVVVGSNNAISAQTGISGSTKVGNNCIFGGQVGLTGHIEIADNVLIGAQSGVSKGITKPGTYFGSPAKELRQTLRLEGHIRNLPNYADKLKSFEDRIAELEEQIIKLKEGKS
ncbi:MAG: UDP-3-O-(3-hydroxymyristoyl)glucosamine N-acyltransferase [Bacteroidetes bacterium]|nr:UDP-3-O-(3-hydroxymyristoyl)glucosamine N-acyltransferase [Bacteroidota bacterium]